MSTSKRIRRPDDMIEVFTKWLGPVAVTRDSLGRIIDALEREHQLNKGDDACPAGCETCAILETIR